MMNRLELTAHIPGAVLKGDGSVLPTSVATDSRACCRGALLIDETYNANPDSVRAAIDHLAQLSGVRILVLGDMGEVGQRGLAYHAEMGRHAREQGIESLLAIGMLTPAAVSEFNLKGSPSGQHFTSVEAFISGARDAAAPHSTLLVKGSRFMKMERVITAFLEPNKQPK